MQKNSGNRLNRESAIVLDVQISEVDNRWAGGEIMKNLIAATLILTLTGCATSSKQTSQDPGLAVTNAAVAPAAQGHVRTKQDENGNTQVNVSVKHLAKPSMISPKARSYVIWVKPMGETNYQNVGALRVNQDLEGKYQTSVPYKNFELIVTPESSTMAQSPTGVTVLQKSVHL